MPAFKSRSANTLYDFGGGKLKKLSFIKTEGSKDLFPGYGMGLW